MAGVAIAASGVVHNVELHGPPPATPPPGPPGMPMVPPPLPPAALGKAEVSADGGSPASAEIKTPDDAGAPPGLHDNLYNQIMVEVEAVLEKKADTLWRRGQEELLKLKQERKQVSGTLVEMQARQDVLIKEHSQMRGALVDITTKLEFVVAEMYETLRKLAGQPPPGQGGGAYGGLGGVGGASCYGGAAQLFPDSPAAGESKSGVVNACAAVAAACAAAQATAAKALACGPAEGAAVSAAPGLEDAAAAAPGLCTPPRGTAAEGGASGTLGATRTAGLAESIGLATPLTTTPLASQAPQQQQAYPGSPAVRLSLANALPSAPTPLTSKKLHLAECLGDRDTTAASSTSTRNPGLLLTPVTASSQVESQSNNFAGVGRSPTQPPPISVELEKDLGIPGDPDSKPSLGMEICECDGSSALRIVVVDSDGPVARHNARCEDGAACVQPGDRIIEVNGVSGCSKRMLDQCRSNNKLCFKIAHGATQQPQLRAEAPAFVPGGLPVGAPVVAAGLKLESMFPMGDAAQDHLTAGKTVMDNDDIHDDHGGAARQLRFV